MHLVLGPCQRAKKTKTVEHEGDSDTNYSWCTCNGPQRLRKKTGRNQMKKWDYPDLSIVKKIPGDQRKFTQTQTPVKDHQLMMVQKIHKEWNNSNNKDCMNEVFFFP